MKSLFDANDIMKLFKELDRKIDKLWCQVEQLFERSPINIGSGSGLYKRLFKNKWEFKSLKAGNNVTITSLDNEIEISTTAEPIDCQDIKDCIGINPSGDPTLFLNQQGDYLSVNSFSCNDLLNCSTDNLPEGITNLYFTNSRAISALTGQNISLFLNNVGYITLSSLSAGTGISYNNLTGVITNTAPDQTVVLTAGTGISVSGTYPNFTITNTQSLSGYVPTTRTLTINGTSYDLSADRTWSVGTVTSVSAGTGMSFSSITSSGNVDIDTTKVPYLSSGFSTGLLKWNGSTWVFDNSSYGTGTVTSVAALTIGTSGTDLSSSVVNSTTTPVITLNVPTASATNRGALSSTDWSTFNSKEPAITWAQGDILYGTGVNTYTKLAKNTSATRYLSNTGTSNNPAWAQIDLSNGVTGVLPIANGGTGTSNSYGVCKCFFMDLTSHSVTGTTSETSVLQITLPTNMTATRLRITAFFRVTSYTSGTVNLRFRIGTDTASPTSNIQVAVITANSAVIAPLVRNYTCKTNLLEGANFSGTVYSDEGGTYLYSSTTKDWTTQQYLFVTITPNNSANVVELSSIQILQTDY